MALIYLNNLSLDKQKKTSILDFLEISRSTFYSYKKEYYKYGVKGLEFKSYAPINARKPQYSEQLVNQIKKLSILNPHGERKNTPNSCKSLRCTGLRINCR